LCERQSGQRERRGGTREQGTPQGIRIVFFHACFLLALGWVPMLVLSSLGQSPGGSRTMIHVIAVITAKPGMRDTILTHFRANVPAVKAEKGCIEYGAAIDLSP